ncbi:hypothetical protein LRH25_30840 [Ideonella azotifigens]|nr:MULTISPECIES: hypothetical protein [Ideonella]MCD2344721.1 hypothetical protein [Ideonella azotifigens]HSI51857.1 hypothetical protein [Ideonella sp.]
MLMILQRTPQPDARVWPGRRLLAFADAVAWPVAWANFVFGLPAHLGLAGQCVLAYCGFAAIQRAHQAVVQNPRYHFTTWRWGRWVVLVLAFGYALKLATLLTA